MKKEWRSGLMIILSLGLSALLFPQQVVAADLTGVIVNGTQPSPLPKDLKVSLNIIGDQGLQPVATVTASQDGRFKFQNVSPPPGQSYVVSTQFQEVSYYSQPVQLTPADSGASTQVTVFEVSKDSAPLRVKAQHVILDPRQGFLEAMVMAALENPGQKTIWLGPDEGVTLSLPQGFRHLSNVSGVGQGGAKPVEGGLLITEPILPGVRQITFSFRLGFNKSELLWRQRVDFATDKLQLFIPEGKSTVEGGQLKKVGPFRIKDQAFSRYEAAGLSPGGILDLKVSGLVPGQRNVTKPASIIFGALIFAGLIYALFKKGWAKQEEVPR